MVLFYESMKVIGAPARQREDVTQRAAARGTDKPGSKTPHVSAWEEPLIDSGRETPEVNQHSDYVRKNRKDRR